MNKYFLEGFEKIANTEELRGGKADSIPDQAFDKKKLEAGTKVEAEHTDNKAKAKEIAKDHLAEGVDYYEELKKMEKKLSK